MAMPTGLYRSMRAKLSVCLRKARFPSEEEALRAAQAAAVPLRAYRCDRCGQFHLTSRTKGKPIPRHDFDL